MKEKKRIKTKIGVGSVVNAKVGDTEGNTRKGRIRSTVKYVVGCVQYMAGKKKLLVQFEYGKRKQIGSSLLHGLCSKQEVDMDKPK